MNLPQWLWHIISDARCMYNLVTTARFSGMTMISSMIALRETKSAIAKSAPGTLWWLDSFWKSSWNHVAPKIMLITAEVEETVVEEREKGDGEGAGQSWTTEWLKLWSGLEGEWNTENGVLVLYHHYNFVPSSLPIYKERKRKKEKHSFHSLSLRLGKSDKNNNRENPVREGTKRRQIQIW